MSSDWRELWQSDWQRVKPFFERFRSPTRVQQKAIPPIRDGNDALVIAPTASGKTEAILPPLLARYSNNLIPDEGPLIVYVAPTRALVADVVKRIRGPIRRMGGVVGERTSDRRTWTEGDSCTVLVTTPESLDSVTMRTSECLSSLQGIIIDEIHLLEGGPRGLQLRLVLERIEQTVGRRLQHILASATLPHVDALADRWCNDPCIIQIPGAHELDVTILRRDQLSNWAERTVAEIEAHGSTKVLAFANSRKFVERFATTVGNVLEPSGWTVRTHHSSLSRDERVQTERFFRENDHVLVAATSTLEVGIDIGDVDLVILDGPPFTLNSFLQRIGRGCRRTDTRRILGIADSALDSRVFQALVSAGRDGRSDGRLTPPLLAVAVQQIGASIQQKALESEGGQKPYLTRTVAEQLLEPAVKGREEAKQFLDASLKAASSIGYVELDEAWDGDQRFKIVLRGSKLDSALNTPTFHVVFTPAGGEVDVVLDDSGRTLGDIQWGPYQPGSIVHLSGRPWRVTKVYEDKIAVESLSSSMGQIPSFTAQSSGNISRELAKEVAQHAWAEWTESDVAVYREEDGYRYAHFIGFEAAAILGHHLEQYGYDISDMNPYSFHCDRRWDDADLRPTATDLEELAYQNPTLLEQLEDLGRLYDYIRDEFAPIQARYAYDWEELASIYDELEFIEVAPDVIEWGLKGTDPVFSV